MVKIYTRTVKKRYLNQKRVYTHRYVAIPIPSRFHPILEPFIDKKLEIALNAHADKLIITLTLNPDPAKKVLHDENTTAKTPEKQAKNHADNDETENLLKYQPEETSAD